MGDGSNVFVMVILSKISAISDNSAKVPETKLLQGSQNVLTSQRCFWFLC